MSKLGRTLPLTKHLVGGVRTPPPLAVTLPVNACPLDTLDTPVDHYLLSKYKAPRLYIWVPNEDSLGGFIFGRGFFFGGPYFSICILSIYIKNKAL